MRVNHSENSLGVREIFYKSPDLSYVFAKTVYLGKKGTYFLDKSKRIYLKRIEPTKVNGFLVEFVWEEKS